MIVPNQTPVTRMKFANQPTGVLSIRRRFHLGSPGLILLMLVSTSCTSLLPGNGVAPKRGEQTNTTRFLKTFTDVFESSKASAGEEEIALRKKNRTHIPFVYRNEHGEYSGENSATLLYGYEYNDSFDTSITTLGPLNLITVINGPNGTVLLPPFSSTFLSGGNGTSVNFQGSNESVFGFNFLTGTVFGMNDSTYAYMNLPLFTGTAVDTKHRMDIALWGLLYVNYFDTEAGDQSDAIKHYNSSLAGLLHSYYFSKEEGKKSFTLLPFGLLFRSCSESSEDEENKTTLTETSKSTLCGLLQYNRDVIAKGNASKGPFSETTELYLKLLYFIKIPLGTKTVVRN